MVETHLDCKEMGLVVVVVVVVVEGYRIALEELVENNVVEH